MDHDHEETEEKAWGGARDGAGRPKGRPSLKRAAQAVLEVEERFPGWSPVLHLAAVANDETLDPVIRLDAAKAAAPYLHSRPKPVELDPDGLVELEKRLLQAKIDAAAQAAVTHPGLYGLAERLQRAQERAAGVSIIVKTSLTRAPDDPFPADVIDVQPATPSQEARQAPAGPAPVSAPAAPVLPAPVAYRPVLPRSDGPPAPADWAAPAAPWPERPARAATEYSLFETGPYREGLLGNRS